jgi:hypothetical protein
MVEPYLHSPYVFMEYIKYRANFTFTFSTSSQTRSQDSSVLHRLGYGLEDHGIGDSLAQVQEVSRFSTASRLPLGPTQYLV